MTGLWLYLHFPQLQLETTYGDPAIPRVVIHPTHNQLLQLNGPAAKAGLKKGMGLGCAALLCDGLQVLVYEEEKEEQQLAQLAQDLYQVTADISLYAPDGILLRASQMLSLYQGLQPYWQAVKQQLPSALTYHYATAASPLGARLLARSGADVINQDTQAQVRRLGRCHLEDTDLSAHTIDKLKRVGISDLNGLFQLPVAELARRFDIELVHYVGRLQGQYKHPQQFYHPPVRFVRRLELLYELSDLQWLHQPLTKVLDALEYFLRIREQKCHALEVELHLREQAVQSLTIHSAAGEYKGQKWLDLCQLKLEKLTLNGPVRALVVKAGQSVPLASEEGDLFNQPSGAHCTPLELLSLLQARLGEQSVCGLKLGSDPRPEMSNQRVPPLSRSKGKGLPIDPFCLRPSLLYVSPQPMEEKVRIVRGPERLTTAWWDQDMIRRDYFIARDTEGRWLWVFRDPQQHWYVHGVFC